MHLSFSFMEDTISQERLKKYFNITKKAIDLLKIVAPEKTHLYKTAVDYLDMAKRYYNDAIHFHSEGRDVDAFAALNYAHGWLDAGARIGLFDVQHNSQLFTVD